MNASSMLSMHTWFGKLYDIEVHIIIKYIQYTYIVLCIKCAGIVEYPLSLSLAIKNDWFEYMPTQLMLQLILNLQMNIAA